jgi:N-acetylglucosaminyl-diphospho-decaprenol L-rhamnosyltransferase
MPVMPNEIHIGVDVGRASVSTLARFTKSILWQDVSSASITLLLRTSAAFDREAYLKAVYQPRNERPQVEIRFVEHDTGSGAGHAHNILCGHAAAKGDGLYIGADPEGIFHHGVLAELIRAAERRPRDTLFEFLRFPDERPKVYDQDTWETAWCSRSSFAIAASFFVAVGGFDERLTTSYDDVDLSWRVRLSGGRCILLPNALFYQAASGTEACPATRAEQLAGGRYLALKWHNQAFLEAVEAEMTSTGRPFEDRHSAHEAVSLQPYRKEEIERVCDFDHGFHFSPTRW